METLYVQITNNMEMKKNLIDYEALREKIFSLARKAGRAGARPLLLFYYVMRSKRVPWKEKAVIFASIAYLILPVDILSAKRLPVIGWLDEVAALALAFNKLRKYVTPEMEIKASEVLNGWFGCEYELLDSKLG